MWRDWKCRWIRVADTHALNFLVFMWRFHVHQVKMIFLTYFQHFVWKIKHVSFFHSEWHRHCFWMTRYLRENIDSPYVFQLIVSNQYVEVITYANFLKFNGTKKRFDRAKVTFRCFHWFPLNAYFLSLVVGVVKCRIQIQREQNCFYWRIIISIFNIVTTDLGGGLVQAIKMCEGLALTHWS